MPQGSCVSGVFIHPLGPCKHGWLQDCGGKGAEGRSVRVLGRLLHCHLTGSIHTFRRVGRVPSYIKH